MSMFICRIKQCLVWWRYEVKCVDSRLLKERGYLMCCPPSLSMSFSSTHQGICVAVALRQLFSDSFSRGRVAIKTHIFWAKLQQRGPFSQSGAGRPRVSVDHPGSRVLPESSATVKLQKRDRIKDTLEKLKNLFIFQINAHSHMWTTCSPSRTASSI